MSQLSLFHVACRDGDAATVESLLESGHVDVDARDTYGNTALQLVAQNGDVEMTRLLIARKAGVNLSNNFGRTALHKACWGIRPDQPSFLETCLLLAAHGANLEAPGATNVTPLAIVCAERDRYPLDHPIPPRSDEEKEVYREEIRAASAAFHVQQRRDANWQRRRSFALFLVCYGIRPKCRGTAPLALSAAPSAAPSVAAAAPATTEEIKDRRLRWLISQVFGQRQDEGGAFFVDFIAAYL